MDLVIRNFEQIIAFAYIMIYTWLRKVQMIEVFNGNLDRAFRDVNRMLQLNGVVSEVKARGHHIKPCQARATKKAKREVNMRKYGMKSNKKTSKYMLSIFNPNLLV